VNQLRRLEEEELCRQLLQKHLQEKRRMLDFMSGPREEDPIDTDSPH
jgi:hypothetical protein